MRIPRGNVATYAIIARRIGRPQAVRAVGNALNKNRSSQVPCHRIVRSDGMLGGYAWGVRKKSAILQKEGIHIRNGKVISLASYL